MGLISLVQLLRALRARLARAGGGAALRPEVRLTVAAQVGWGVGGG